MTKRQLLIDSISLKINSLTEDSADASVLRGKFAQADIPTSNGRIYSRKLWERELGKLRSKISEGKVYGELDHPDDGKTKLSRSAVILTGLDIDESGAVNGTLKIMDTARGRDLKAIKEAGGAIGISSRGYGSVKMNEEGKSVVQDDYMLMTFDPVADPAEESAYLQTETIMHKATKTEDADAPAPVAAAQPMAVLSADALELPHDPAEAAKVKAAAAALSTTPDVAGEAPKAPVEGEDVSDEPKLAIEDDESDIGLNADDDEDKKPKAKVAEAEDTNKAKDQDGNAKFQAAKFQDADDDKKDKDMQEALDRQAKKFQTELLVAVKEARESLRAEVRSEMKSDPSIAGARADLDKVRSILRPYILPEDTEKTLSGKDAEIKALKEELSKTRAKLSSMTEAAKEMGFNLYMERNLSGLPKEKVKGIVESLGDYAKISSLDELKKRLAPKVQESKALIEDKDKRIKALTETLKKKTVESETLREELQDVLEMSQENAARLYLERMITGNPQQVELRRRFEDLERKDKKSVDKLVASSRTQRAHEATDFSRVRSRLTAGRKISTDGLVEAKIKETQREKMDEQFEPIEGHKFSMSEINKLAGVR